MSLLRDPFLRGCILQNRNVGRTVAVGVKPLSKSDGFQGNKTIRFVSTMLAVSDDTDCSKESPRRTGWQTFTRGMESFLKHMQLHVPDFEFHVMPHDATISLVFRPISCQVDEWAPIITRVALMREGRHCFQRIHHGTFVNEVFLFDLDDCKLYLVSMDESPRYIAIYPKSDLYASNEIRDAEMRYVLLEYWKRNVRHPKWQWLLAQGVFSRRNYPTWAECAYATIKTLYEPLGISVEFPMRDVGANMILDRRVRVLHRTIIPRRIESGHVKYYGHLRSPAFSVSAEIQFFIFVKYCSEEKKTNGLFVFPKDILHGRGCLRDEVSGLIGKRSMMVYPPSVKTYTSGSRANQEWQSEFYVDLSNEGEVEKKKTRFQEILGLI